MESFHCDDFMVYTYVRKYPGIYFKYVHLYVNYTSTKLFLKDANGKI